jgi:hypothetical protein
VKPEGRSKVAAVNAAAEPESRSKNGALKKEKAAA